MKTSKFGEIVLDQEDLCDLVMRGHNIAELKRATVDQSVDIERLAGHLEDPSSLLTWTFPYNSDKSVPEFDLENQALANRNLIAK